MVLNVATDVEIDVAVAIEVSPGSSGPKPLKVVQARNRKIQRLNSAQMIARVYRQKKGR